MPHPLSSLRLIELTLNRGGVKTRDSIEKLKKLTKPIHSRSCVRHLFIFREIEDKEALLAVMEELKSKNRECKLYVGAEAYQFLLSWVVGGEYRNPKKGAKIAIYNDNHVLGKFTKNWNYFLETNQDIKEKYIHLVQILFEEAHAIRHRIELGKYGEGEKLRETLDTVINNICFSKKYSLPVAYDSMHGTRKEYVCAVFQILNKKIQVISQVLKKSEISGHACLNLCQSLQDKIHILITRGFYNFNGKTNRQIHCFFKEQGLFKEDEAFRKESYQKACEESRDGYQRYLSSKLRLDCKAQDISPPIMKI